MLLNETYFALFRQNWAETLRAVKRLQASLDRLALDIPLTEQSLKSENEDLFEKLDAFRVRFATLQDCLGNKLFRNLLRSEDEQILNMADTLARMEKRHILDSTEEWRKMREIRNAFSHDYPESEKDRADALNAAWCCAPQLIEITCNIHSYLSRHHQETLEPVREN